MATVSPLAPYKSKRNFAITPAARPRPPLDKGEIPGVRQFDPALYPGHGQLLEVATAQGLLSAAQLNVIEFHTWNAVKTAIGKPDRMTFDLHPGDVVKWPQIQQAAELVRVFLEQLELASFVKTSGGNGLQ